MGDPQALVARAVRQRRAWRLLRPLSLGVASMLLVGCLAINSLVGRPFRTPGERLKAFPEKVWKQYDCSTKKLPMFTIERLELGPKRLKAGEEFNHRIVYALCPKTPTGVVTGRLETRILHRGMPIVKTVDEVYDLKPGRWVVDAFIKLPEDAEVGIYAFEIEFRSRRVRFEKQMTFAVDPSDD